MTIFWIIASLVVSLVCGFYLWKFATLQRDLPSYSLAGISFLVAAYSFTRMSLGLGGDLEAFLFLIYWLGPVVSGGWFSIALEKTAAQWEEEEHRSAFSSDI